MVQKRLLDYGMLSIGSSLRYICTRKGNLGMVLCERGLNSRGSARFLAKIEHDPIYFFFEMKKQNNQFVIGSVYFDFGLFFGCNSRI